MVEVMSEACWKKHKTSILEELKSIVGSNRATDSFDVCVSYAFNAFWGKDVLAKPDIVVLPETPQEISEILKLANKYVVPVTPKGAVGGAGHGGPLKGGILLDLSLIDRILLIDTVNMKTVAEAGCSFFKLSQELFKRNLILPTAAYGSGPSVAASFMDPAYAFGATRYGGNANLVEGIEVVLPSGEILTVGSMAYFETEFGPYFRFITGPDLVGLFTKSNGSFGIVTKVAYRCLHKPKCWSFHSYVWPLEKLQQCVQAMREASAIEVFDIHVNDRQRWTLKNGSVIPEDYHFVVIFALNAENEMQLKGEEKALKSICEAYEGKYLPSIAEDFHTVWPCDFMPEEKMFPPRRSLPAKVPRKHVYLFDELIHPLSWMANIYWKMVELCRKHELPAPIFDSFVLNAQMSSTQFSIPLDDSNAKLVRRFRQCQSEFREWYTRKGGTFQHRLPPYLPDKVWTNQLGAFKLLKQIKALLDPNDILSPGTFELFESQGVNS